MSALDRLLHTAGQLLVWVATLAAAAFAWIALDLALGVLR